MPAAELVTVDYVRGLAERLAAARHGEQGKLIDEAARMLSCSRQQVYRRLRAVGWASGRKLRADRGDVRLSDEAARLIAGIMSGSTRQNGKRLLSVADAIGIAHANGKLRREVSPSTALRIMRGRGLHPEQLSRPAPHTTMRSLHPNHVCQFDVSVCVLFYLDQGGLCVMDEKRFYKNKPANLKRVLNDRVLRYVSTDHYSGAFYLHYYLVGGENQETLFDYLMRAWRRREHEQDPFHGVPALMVWDAGSANQSHMIRNLLTQLDVDHWAHTPENPRAKGQVESTHNLIERSFEGRLWLDDIRSIEALNEKAHAWMRWYNGARIHTRHGHTRYAMWQTIRREQLRLCPDRALCEQLLTTKPEPRQVKGNLVVQYTVKGYEPGFYSVAHVPNVRVGETVQVCVNPYRAPAIFVIAEDRDGREHRHECEPLGRDCAGFLADAPVFRQGYRSQPDTDVDTHRKHIAKEVYEAATLEQAEATRRARKPGYGGKLDAFSYLEAQTSAHYMDRPGTPLGVPDAIRVTLKPLTPTQAAIRLRAQIGRALTTDENAYIRTQYPEGVPEEEVSRLAERLAARGRLKFVQSQQEAQS